MRSIQSMLSALVAVVVAIPLQGDGDLTDDEEKVYTDDEVKAQIVKAGMFCHADFIRGGYRLAFEMADGDTNRYARILRELAGLRIVGEVVIWIGVY